jgi:hypothetical protein
VTSATLSCCPHLENPPLVNPCRLMQVSFFPSGLLLVQFIALLVWPWIVEDYEHYFTIYMNDLVVVSKMHVTHMEFFIIGYLKTKHQALTLV